MNGMENNVQASKANLKQTAPQVSAASFVRSTLLMCAAAAMALCLHPTAKSHAAETEISIELNKLEYREKDATCRVYVLINNRSQVAYTDLSLDLVMFRTDGIMDKRLNLKLAPLSETKMKVKLFDLKDVACDQVGWLLLNDVRSCKTEQGPVENCLSKISVSSRASVKLTK